MSILHPLPEGNPFSTRFTRPGALPFHFDEGEDASHVVGQLRQHNWFGQIIGPHGSGKSTLLAALRPALEAEGRDVRLVQLRQSERPLNRIAAAVLGDRHASLEQLAPRRLTPVTQLIVDGYEQLGPVARWVIKARCRRRGCGLLVTSHRDAGLPTIYSTRPSLALAVAIVRRLTAAADAIDDADVEAAWLAHGGNLREMLFHLYDSYERRRQPGG